MKDNTDKSLKSQNMKWLVGLASLDVLVVLLFVVPETVNMASMSQLAIARGLATSVMPVVVLLLIGVLPHDVKSMLVYWKARGVVPGCEAFTKCYVRRYSGLAQAGCPEDFSSRLEIDA